MKTGRECTSLGHIQCMMLLDGSLRGCFTRNSFCVCRSTGLKCLVSNKAAQFFMTPRMLTPGCVVLVLMEEKKALPQKTTTSCSDGIVTFRPRSQQKD